MTQIGRFITVEGIDGAGKTCNLSWIHSQLIQAGFTVLCTRGPGGTGLGEEIRDLLLRQRTLGMEPISELLLLAAARAEHVVKTIRPALARGEWVLCDRFSDATYAYQGGGRRLDVATLTAIEGMAQNGLRPDLTLLLDLPVEVGRARIQQRAPLNRIDQETMAFFERVRAAYLHRAAIEPQRIRIIDATRDLVQVQQELAQCIHNFCINI